MNYDINVSIVVYHPNLELLRKTINSVLESEHLKIKIYIIDNSTTNIIQSDLEKISPHLEYIFNNKNLGYGSAHNIALQKSIKDKITYHVILNPDVWFNKNVLFELYNFMQQNHEVGNIMPKVLYANGEEQYLCKLVPKPSDLIFRRFMPLKNLKKRYNNIYELRFTQYDKIMNVPILSGCFMFLRTEVLKKVGIFDERFFMYLEDVDFSRRLHKDTKTLFYPHVFIFHGYAKESYKNKTLLKYHIQSAIKYFNKWGWLFDKERTLINKRALNQLLKNSK